MPRARPDRNVRQSAVPPDPSPKAVRTGGTEADGPSVEGRPLEAPEGVGPTPYPAGRPNLLFS